MCLPAPVQFPRLNVDCFQDVFFRPRSIPPVLSHSGFAETRVRLHLLRIPDALRNVPAPLLHQCVKSTFTTLRCRPAGHAGIHLSLFIIIPHSRLFSEEAGRFRSETPFSA